MPIELDYRAPSTDPPRVNVRVAATAGVVGGAVAMLAAIFLGNLAWIAFVVVGIFVSAVAADRSRGREFRAGLVANAFAAATAMTIAAVVAILFSTSTRRIGPSDLAWVATDGLVCWVVCAVPGLLGSLAVWEGNRPSRLGETLDADRDRRAARRG